jgi:hypothetical protein
MKQGFLSQYALIPVLEGMGVSVSLPCDPHCTYDLITDADGLLLRVQVKSCGILKRNRYKVDIMCGATNQKRPYSEGMLDAFIVHIPTEASWYVIPAAVIAGQKWVSLYPHDQTGKYEPFRDAWHLLWGKEAAMAG